MTIKEKVLKGLRKEHKKFSKEKDCNENIVGTPYMWSNVKAGLNLFSTFISKRIMTYPNACSDCKTCDRAWKKLKKEFVIK